MSDTIDDLQWLTDLDGGDVPPSAASLQLAGDQLAAAIAGSSTTTTSPSAVNRRRWRAAGLVGVAATGIVVTLLAGPGLPGGMGSESASAQTQLRRIADRAEASPFPDYPFSSETREEATYDPPRSDRFTWRACTTITLSPTDAAVQCASDHPDAPPTMLYQGNPNVTDIAVARTPEEIAARVDEFVVDRSTEVDWSGEPSDPTELRTVAIGLTLSSYTLEPELRATLLRLLAEIPRLGVETDAVTTAGARGTRFTVNGAHGGTWAITVDPADGFVLELRASALVTPASPRPGAESIAIGRPTHLRTLPAPVATLAGRLALLPDDPGDETGLRVGGPGRSIDCAGAVDPTTGTVSDVDGWSGTRCLAHVDSEAKTDSRFSVNSDRPDR